MACDTGVILVTWPDLLPPGPSACRVRQCGHDEAAIDLRAAARRGRRARRGPGDGGRPRGRACAWDARRRRTGTTRRSMEVSSIAVATGVDTIGAAGRPPAANGACWRDGGVGSLTRVRWRRGCPYERAHCEPQPQRRPYCSTRIAVSLAFSTSQYT